MARLFRIAMMLCLCAMLIAPAALAFISPQPAADTASCCCAVEAGSVCTADGCGCVEPGTTPPPAPVAVVQIVQPEIAVPQVLLEVDAPFDNLFADDRAGPTLAIDVRRKFCVVRC